MFQHHCWENNFSDLVSYWTANKGHCQLRMCLYRPKNKTVAAGAARSNINHRNKALLCPSNRLILYLSHPVGNPSFTPLPLKQIAVIQYTRQCKASYRQCMVHRFLQIHSDRFPRGHAGRATGRGQRPERSGRRSRRGRQNRVRFDAMLSIKTQVVVQYGDDSDQAQALGL